MRKNMALNRKGVVLVMMIVFILVIMITSFALYQTVGNFCDIQSKNAIKIKGDYIISAGIDYAQMLLKDPVANLGFTLQPNNEIAIRHINQSNNKPLADNLGIVTASQDLAVTIQERSDGSYNVTSVYSY